MNVSGINNCTPLQSQTKVKPQAFAGNTYNEEEIEKQLTKMYEKQQSSEAKKTKMSNLCSTLLLGAIGILSGRKVGKLAGDASVKIAEKVSKNVDSKVVNEFTQNISEEIGKKFDSKAAADVAQETAKPLNKAISFIKENGQKAFKAFTEGGIEGEKTTSSVIKNTIRNTGAVVGGVIGVKEGNKDNNANGVDDVNEKLNNFGKAINTLAAVCDPTGN